MKLFTVSLQFSPRCSSIPLKTKFCIDFQRRSNKSLCTILWSDDSFSFLIQDPSLSFVCYCTYIARYPLFLLGHQINCSDLRTALSAPPWTGSTDIDTFCTFCSNTFNFLTDCSISTILGSILSRTVRRSFILCSVKYSLFDVSVPLLRSTSSEQLWRTYHCWFSQRVILHVSLLHVLSDIIHICGISHFFTVSTCTSFCKQTPNETVCFLQLYGWCVLLSQLYCVNVNFFSADVNTAHQLSHFMYY